MPSHAPQSKDERGRVVPFQRPGQVRPRVPPPSSEGSPVEGMEKYAGGDEPDNYRQRMINNGLAFIFCVVLVVIGVWLATAIAEMRKNQDCVLSGRRNCAHVNAPPANPI